MGYKRILQSASISNRNQNQRAIQTESLELNFENEGIVYGAQGQIHQMPSKPCNHQAENFLTSQQKSGYYYLNKNKHKTVKSLHIAFKHLSVIDLLIYSNVI
jgi:hypothetical protein